MKTKPCPMCKGTGRVEVETMNKEQMRTDLKKGVKHWAQHGKDTLHLNSKTKTRECFDSILMYSDKLLEELDKEEEEEGPKPPPPPPPPKPSRLAIVDGVLCFGNDGKDPLSAFGIARREILDRADGHHGGLYGRPLKFFLDLTEEYNLNFERVDSTDNLNILGVYLDDRAEKDVVVELTIADDERPEMGDPYTIIDFVAGQGYRNVIIECWNEFGHRDGRYVDDIRRWCRYSNDKGLLTSAGAYDYKPVSEEFDPVFSNNRIISIHQSYKNKADVKNTVRPYKNSRKPMSWNEPHHMSADDFYNAAKWFYAEGVRLINGYFLRTREFFPDLTNDISPWREYYRSAQLLREELSA